MMDYRNSLAMCKIKKRERVMLLNYNGIWDMCKWVYVRVRH